MHNSFISMFCKQTKLKFSTFLDLVEDGMSYYVAFKGRIVEIYRTWDKCKAQVQFSKPIFKKFVSIERQQFINEHSGASSFRSTRESKKLFYPTQKTFALGKTYDAQSTSKRFFSTVDNSDGEESITSKQKKSNSNTKNEKGFFVDENGFTEVYTDGACTCNGKGNARAGIGIWFADGHALNVSQPVIGRATNNMAEIQAVTVAAKLAQKAGIRKLKINTDSQFLINCITKWMPKWKKTGWKNGNKKPVINKQELIEMEKALAPLEISWNHVRGHVGIHGNKIADKLAREGSERYH